jgi:hypothetical protein
MPRPKSLTVYGKAFIRAREAFANKKDARLKGDYGDGTQEWLAHETGISIKTIRALETNNKATLRTIDKISEKINFEGREYIIGYGSEWTSCRAFGVVDFRSIEDGRDTDDYYKRPFVITIDPILVEYIDDFTSSASLDAMKLVLSIDDFQINFEWLYFVELTGSSGGWLGYQSAVLPIRIRSGISYNKSVMFKQDIISPMNWASFIDLIRESSSEQLKLTINLKFEYFEKSIDIFISANEMKELFCRAQEKYNLTVPYPYFMQLKPKI